MDNNAHVLGPPPSYESVVYGTDAASGTVQTGTNLPPPPAQYPTAPYTYPVPFAPANAAQPQYPTTYPSSQTTGTTIIRPATIVHANQQPLSTTVACRRAIIVGTCVVLLFIILILSWRLS